MNSKAPVVILVAIILMGALLWVTSAIRMSGGVPPEQAEALAEEAERECVLEGHSPEACPKMVGRHHQDCLASADRVNGGEGARVDDTSYINCMLEAFGEPEDGTVDAGTTPDTESPDAGADAASEDAEGDDVGDADATDEETD
ncbi:MAG: hypothetical protein ABEN55_22985 [Bradymonadaceae bacterium]